MSKVWPRAPLGEVLKERREAPSSDDLDSGRVRVIEKISFDTGRMQLRVDASTKTGMILARPGDLVISGINAAKGAIAIYDPSASTPVAATIHYGAYIPDQDRVDIHFLWWMLRSQLFRELLLEYLPGGIKTELKSKRLLPIPVPLPSLAEQRRVVAQIEKLAGQIQHARDYRAEAAEETNALYGRQLAVILQPHHQGWRCDLVANIIVSMDAGWSPQCDDIPAIVGEWGVLKTTAVQWCEFRPQENKALPPTLKPVPELAVVEGDVLVTRAGPMKRVGVVACVRKTEPHLTISDKIIRLRPDLGKIEPRFLELSLASPFSQEHLIQRKTGLADAQVNISQAILRSTPVAYPSLAEQRGIIREMDALQAHVELLKNVQTETATELDALLSAILDRAFKGELV